MYTLLLLLHVRGYNVIESFKLIFDLMYDLDICIYPCILFKQLQNEN